MENHDETAAMNSSIRGTARPEQKLTRTQRASRAAYDLRERKIAERHPLVQAVMAAFPGAEIVCVRPPGPTVTTPDFESGNAGSIPAEAAT